MILRIAAAVISLYIFKTVVASPDQVVLGPSSNMADFVRLEGNMPTLADLLTLETRASIFYSYSREVDISARFMKNEGEGVTVFVPTNKAVQALARKPHEGPLTEGAGVSDAEHESISRSNVRRWVGAHIIPSPDVDFTSPGPYDTLTSGATISFKHIGTQGASYPADGSRIDTDAQRLGTVKGPGGFDSVDTDAAHFASIKGPVGQSDHVQEQSRPVVDTDAAHFSAIKGPQGSDDPHMKVRFGLAAAGRVDTDAAHFATVKGPASPNRAPQAELTQTSDWKQYELNDGVHIIAKKEASNGIMYLIDGTVPV